MPEDVLPLRRALISVSDKTGLIEHAKALAEAGAALVSTGGTKAAIADAGLAVQDVSAVTGFPEMMDGRVKTLHPKVHGGLLALRDEPEHAKAMKEHGIEGFDLLYVNLYPFEATVARGAAFDDCIENIDIGGPAMIRAAAKNFGFVAVATDADDMAAVLAEVKAHGGTTLGATQAASRESLRTHRRLRCGDLELVRRPTRRRGAGLARGWRQAEAEPALRREPAPERRVLCDGRASLRRFHRAPGSGQGAELQQSERYGRRL